VAIDLFQNEMGSSPSSSKKKDDNVIDHVKHQLLLQRKVTTDVLEKLARGLPAVPNPLSKTLK